MERYYRVSGLNLQSPIPIPEIPLSTVTDPSEDVAIRWGPVRPDLKNPRWRGLGRQVKPDHVLLKVGERLRLLVRPHQGILVDANPNCPHDLIKAFILGPVLAAVLNQMGRLVLRGSAFELEGGAWVVLGSAGTGKSSLMGALHSREIRVLCDQLAVILPDEKGPGRVVPELPHLRLWADIMRMLDSPTLDLPRVRAEQQRYFVPLGSGFCPTPLPLSGVFVLPALSGPPNPVGPLEGVTKFRALTDHVYQRPSVIALGLERPLFTDTSRIAETVPVIRLPRLRGRDSLAQLADLVLSQVRQHSGCSESDREAIA